MSVQQLCANTRDSLHHRFFVTFDNQLDISLNNKFIDMNKEEIQQIWLDAEEELRNENDNKCLELKDKFSEEYDKLSDEDKQDVKDYIDSVAG